MQETEKFNVTNASLVKASQKTGQSIRQAMLEVAEKKGGDQLVEDVVAKFSAEELLPDYNALQHLEDLEPGIAGQIVERAEQIQLETHDQKYLNTKSSLRKIGSTLINFIDTFNLKS